MIATLLSLALLAPPPTAETEKLSATALEHASSGRAAEAAKLWQQALQLSPSHFPSLFNYGFLLYSQKRFGEAEPLLARAAKVRPSDFNTRFLLGSTLLDLDRREDALRQWRTALALQPANTRLMQVMTVEYTAGRYFNEACDLGQKSVAVKGDAPEPWLIAIKACQDAQSPAAARLAQQAAAKFPDSARAQFEHAFHLQRSGRMNEAMPLLDRAMKLDPNYEEPYYFSGELLLLEDRPQEAAARLRTALRIRPDYVPACATLARALMTIEQYGEALAELENCSKASPAHPQPHLLLSQIYYRTGDEGRARSEKEISFRLRRENPTLMEAPQARPFPARSAR
jgi:tetratricopeptide (TPR) repeat protein